MRELRELAPDARYREDHVLAWTETGSFRVNSMRSATGLFENLHAYVTQVDSSGLTIRHDVYDLDQLAQARQRYAEIARGAR